MASKWAKAFVEKLERIPADKDELAALVTEVQKNAVEAFDRHNELINGYSGFWRIYGDEEVKP